MASRPIPTTRWRVRSAITGPPDLSGRPVGRPGVPVRVTYDHGAGSQRYSVRVPTRLGAAHGEAAGQGALPRRAVVGVEHAGSLAGEQPGRHRVVAVGELDDQRGPEVGEEGDDLVERHGVGERQVVDDRQAQHEVGPHAVDERRALARPPAEAGRRVGRGRGRAGRMRRSPAARSSRYRRSTTRWSESTAITERRPGLDGQPGEVPVVGAEVEHEAGSSVADGGRDERAPWPASPPSV